MGEEAVMIGRTMVSARRALASVSVLGLLACVLALVLSASPAMAAECPNEQLRKESNVDPSTGRPFSTELPDCRAYEMVSPLEKQAHGAGVAVSNNGAERASDRDLTRRRERRVVLGRRFRRPRKLWSHARIRAQRVPVASRDFGLEYVFGVRAG